MAQGAVPGLWCCWRRALGHEDLCIGHPPSYVLMALLQAAPRSGRLQDRSSPYAFELEKQALVLGKLKVDNFLREAAILFKPF